MDEINLALLVLRVVIGLTLIPHGIKKLFGEGAIEGTAGWFESIGMRPSRANAYAAGTTEILFGAMMALGFLTTFAAMGYVAVMTVALVTTHLDKGFFILDQGWEYVVVLGTTAIVVAMLGPGEWSIDNGLSIANDLDGWTGLILAGGLGVAAGLGQMAAFFRPSSVSSS